MLDTHFALVYLVLNKKYLDLICLVLFELDHLPLFTRRIVDLLLLSWYKMFCSTVYPCSSMKYLAHKISGSTSSIPTSSPSQELLTFNFCFLHILSKAPFPDFPRVVIPPVCPLQSSWVLYEASTHQQILFRSLTLNVSFMYFVPFKYFMTLFSLPQSSSSGFFTLVVRNATGVAISPLRENVKE